MPDDPVWSPKNIDRLERLCLYDDKFMTIVLGQHSSCAELLLKIILNVPEVKLRVTQEQKRIINLSDQCLKGHDAILDLYAVDVEGTQFNVEVQNQKIDYVLKRARYYAGLLDAQSLQSGVSYVSLSDLYAIFICRHDPFDEDKPKYVYEYRSEELSLDIGVHIIIANGACMDDSPLGRLIHDMHCANPDEMYYDELRKICGFYKKTNEGRLVMTGVFAEIWEEGREEGKANATQEIALKLMAGGVLSHAQIAECTNLSMEQVQALVKQQKQV